MLTKAYTVAPESRRTIYVDDESFPGLGQALANAALSCAITSTNGVPIVVERSMWFPGPAVTPTFWTEAHNSAGATSTATRWVLADGESRRIARHADVRAHRQHVAHARTGPADGAAGDAGAADRGPRRS